MRQKSSAAGMQGPLAPALCGASDDRPADRLCFWALGILQDASPQAVESSSVYRGARLRDSDFEVLGSKIVSVRVAGAGP